MAIRQYTTPTLPLFIPGMQIADADSIYVTFETQDSSSYTTERRCKHGNILDGEADCENGGSFPNTFTGSDIIVTEDESGTTILVPLSQEQTGKLIPGTSIKAQVNWIKNGKRYATEKASIPVTDNLLKVVLPL